jgi:hypothetical protein
VKTAPAATNLRESGNISASPSENGAQEALAHRKILAPHSQLGCVNYHFTEEKCLVFQWLEGRFSWSATAHRAPRTPAGKSA